ncbi:fish-egg lectin-like [Oncorhynchus keta]|uniref:fish-egg lectin-like n=1 Tax=Oncorhynchus keta TaxID=8018 RepID=UPI00227B3A8C|nr:fish-egg lectin-like [Oncorhynchus keta]
MPFLKQVDAGGNQFVVGVYMKDTSFCLTSSATVGYKGPGSPLPWTGLPGAVKYSSCGHFGCWAVNKNDDIFLMSLNQDCRNNGWSHIDGKLSMIEVATDGSVFGVTSAGSVYTRMRIQKPTKTKLVSGSPSLIEVATDGSVFRGQQSRPGPLTGLVMHSPKHDPPNHAPLHSHA